MNNARNEIGFRIQRAKVSAAGVTGAYKLIGSALANTTTFSDASAVAGTTYRYRVVAFNAAGNTLSNTVRIKR